MSYTFVPPGDANNDGTVDDKDASIVGAHWRTSGASWADGDFNGDGMVNDADAAILAAYWGPTAQGGGVSVPEPGILTMLFGAAALLLLIKRR